MTPDVLQAVVGAAAVVLLAVLLAGIGSPTEDEESEHFR